MQNISKNLRLYRNNVYTEFVRWTALPEHERVNTGIKTQGDFAAKYQVSESTLSLWKRRSDFEPRVDELLHHWAIGKTPSVINGMYRSAVKGNPMSQALWLQYFKKFNPKASGEEEGAKVVLGVGDIRHLIEQLPEDLKQKHYGYLRELAEDFGRIRNSQPAERSDWAERPAEPISESTDGDAQSLPNIRCYEMAEGDTRCLPSNMVWQAFSYYH